MSAHDCGHHSVAVSPGPTLMGACGQPCFRRIRLGGLLVTALSDGQTPLPFDKLLTGGAPGEVRDRLAANGLESTVDTCVNTYLIERGDTLVLIDAGAGSNLPGCGKLTDSMAAAGYRPDQVDAILLTHIHPDHVGGLVSDTGIVFPKAELLTSAADLEYWFSPEEEAQAPAGRRKIFEQSKAGVDPYLRQGRVRQFLAGDEVLPGIRTAAAPGHTAGHVLIRIEGNGEAIVFFGDLVHLAAVQMAAPNVAISLDSDQETAVATRLEWFDRFAAAGTLVAGAHMPFPGIGRIARRGAGYEWFPLADAQEPRGVFRHPKDRS